MELIDDAKHWHERAKESRALAEQMTNPDAQRIMYCIAASYRAWRNAPRSDSVVERSRIDYETSSARSRANS